MSQQPRPYDFRNPKRASSDSPWNLDTLACALGRGLAESFTEHLASEITVAPAAVESVRFDEFLASVSSPACLSLLRVDPPGVQVCLDLEPAIVFPMIDRLLGGGGGSGVISTHRALTQFEQSLALGIIERSARLLADTWSRVAPVSVREDELISDPGHVRLLMPADEVIVVMRFDCVLGDSSGALRFALPVPVVSLVGDAPPAAAPILTPLDRERDGDNLQRNIMEAAIELRALLAETKLRLNEVASMQVGDVITTDGPADASVPVQVEGRELFRGDPGHFRGTRAVHINRVNADENEKPGQAGGFSRRSDESATPS